MARSLAGKVAVVTGASSGIGRATAVRLSADGARVVLGARRADRLEEVADGKFGDSLSWSLRLYEHGPKSVEFASAPHTDTSGTYRPSTFSASLSFPGSKILAEATGGSQAPEETR